MFSGADDGIVATHLEHDAPLYEEDVVEAFLAPRRALVLAFVALALTGLGASRDCPS